MSEVFERQRELGLQLHEAEAEVHQRKIAKQTAINLLRTAQLENWGDAISGPHNAYCVARDALIAARAKRTEARKALEGYKETNLVDRGSVSGAATRPVESVIPIWARQGPSSGDDGVW